MEPRSSMSTSSNSSRAPRPPSILSNKRTTHSRGHSSDEPSQPPSPMTYFPNPSTFTSEPNPQYLPSIQTSPSLGSSSRLGGSISHSSLSSEEPGLSSATVTRTPRVAGDGHELQAQQQQFYYPTPTGQGSTSAAAPSSWRDHSSTSQSVGPGASPHPQGSARRSTSVAARAGSTPVGYGATGRLPAPIGNPTSGSDGMNALGLGATNLVDTRRIASTPGIVIPGPSGQRRLESPQAAPALSLPGTYIPPSSHSQPNTAAGTPRYRVTREDHSANHQHHGSFSSALGSAQRAQSARPTHRRGVSVTSTLAPVQQVPTPSSPVGSVFRRLRRVGSNMGIAVRPTTYDDESDYEMDDGEHDGQRANGTRVWYSSYVTIDWLHDAIKDSSRVRRIRGLGRRSLRGGLMNAWDRSQGWILATVIGVLTACIAWMIIRSEMAFFDLKEGFCGRSWGTAKRFCCAPRMGHGHPDSGEEEQCDDWVEWGDFFGRNESAEAAFWSEPEFMAYFVIAIMLACTSSALTYYLSSSANHVTSKDSAFLGPVPEVQSPNASPTKARGGERQPLLLSEDVVEAEEAAPAPARPVIYMAAGSGIPEIKTILSGFVIHGYLGMSTLVVKSIGLAMSVGSGLSLGKEGPFVHIASCIANIVSRVFVKYETNEGKRREVLSAACAAGVAVSFGAPIGGVLFSLEEVSYYFPPKVMWRSFWCAAVAAITLKALNPYGNGSIVLFAVTYSKEYHYWEFAIFILLGVFGGLYGALFSRLNIIWSRDIRKGTWVGRHPIFEVAMVVAVTTVVSFMNPYTRLGGTELVAKLFSECRVDTNSSLCVKSNLDIWPIIQSIGLALIIKAILTIVTFGIVLPAGIFIPSLVIGACFGRIVGILMEWFEFNHPQLGIFNQCRTEPTACVVPGIYAMVGAAATLAGVTRTTVSLAVIMFELTGTLNYVAPVMLAVLVAKTTADALEKRGIYELVIELKKLPYLSNKEEYLWGGRLVSEVMDRDAPTLRADKPHTVRELTGKLLELVRLGYADAGFPVLTKEAAVDQHGRNYPTLRVLGFLGINEIEHALTALQDEPDAVVNLNPNDDMRSSRLSIFSFSESADGRYNPYDLGQYINRAPITVQVHSPLELVQQMFVKLGARQILVTDSRGTYRGALYKKQWIAFLDELEDELAG